MLHTKNIAVNVFVIGSEAAPEAIRSKIAEAVSELKSQEKKPRKRYSRSLKHDKYLDSREVNKLRKTLLKKRGMPALRRTPVYDWFLVELALNSGLRVMEIASLRWKDIQEKNSCIQVLVRNGKNSKERTVLCGRQLNESLRFFRRWKQDNNESLSEEAPVFFSNRTGKGMTRRALQESVKRSIRMAKLKGKYSIHCLRHTFGTHLLKASGWNLRFVQQQLGHSSIATTEIYAKVMSKDGEKAVKKLYDN